MRRRRHLLCGFLSSGVGQTCSGTQKLLQGTGQECGGAHGRLSDSAGATNCPTEIEHIEVSCQLNPSRSETGTKLGFNLMTTRGVLEVVTLLQPRSAVAASRVGRLSSADQRLK